MNTRWNKMVVVMAFAAVGCSKKSVSCEEVFEHTVTLAPPEIRSMLEKSKGSAIEKCSKMSDEAKQCAIDAKSMEDLQKCPRDK